MRIEEAVSSHPTGPAAQAQRRFLANEGVPSRTLATLLPELNPTPDKAPQQGCSPGTRGTPAVDRGVPHSSRRRRGALAEARNAAAASVGALDQLVCPPMTDRAIPVPHRRVNPGQQRTATVNVAGPISWSSLARPARTHPANMPDKEEVPGSSPGVRMATTRGGGEPISSL
jgi:hypothetical protein